MHCKYLPAALACDMAIYCKCAGMLQVQNYYVYFDTLLIIAKLLVVLSLPDLDLIIGKRGTTGNFQIAMHA